MSEHVSPGTGTTVDGASGESNDEKTALRALAEAFVEAFNALNRMTFVERLAWEMEMAGLYDPASGPFPGPTFDDRRNAPRPKPMTAKARWARTTRRRMRRKRRAGKA